MAAPRLSGLSWLFVAALLFSALVPVSLEHLQRDPTAPVPSGGGLGAIHSPPTREIIAPDLPPTPHLVGPGPIQGYHFASTALGIQYGQPTWLAYDSGTRSYYIAQNNSTVSVVAAQSIGVVAVTIPVGSGPFGVAYDPADGRVFVANSGSNNVSVIADATNRTVAEVAVGSTPYGVAYDNGSGLLFVANGGSGTVTVVDASTLAVVANVSVGTEPVGIAYDPVDGDVYVANEGSADVSVISTATDAVVATVAVGVAPYGVAVDNATGDVYVSDSQSGAVTVIGPSGSSVVATLAVGGTPEGLTYDWRNQTVWVAEGSAFVVVINASQNTIVADLFFDPLGAAYNSDNGDVCFTNAANATFQCVSWRWVAFDGGLANLTFNESGLPAGTVWTVSVSGLYETDTEISTNASTMVFQVFWAFPVQYTVVPLSGWSATPSAGEAQYFPGQDNVNISFVRAPGNFTITFVESGLVFNPWNSLSWGVSFAGVVSHSPGLPIVVAATNGTYTYLGYPVPGYAPPRPGQVTVQGADTIVVIDYSTTVTYFIGFQESGLPIGQMWSVTLNGTLATSASSTIGFIEPDGTYEFAIGPVAGWTTASFVGSVVVAGANLTVPVGWTQVTYPVVLTEEGLPSRTNWSGSIDGLQKSSTTSTLTFVEPNGSYSFAPGLVPGWTTLAPAPTIDVNGSPVAEGIPWFQVVYAVAFTESGLATGTTWSVAINGTEQTATSASLAFAEPNGSYGFVVTAPQGYAASPATGSVTVDGADASQGIAFSLVSAPLTANFSYQIQYATCLSGGGVTNYVLLGAEAAGGTAPYTFEWTLPTGRATTALTATTLTLGQNTTVTLVATDAVGHTATRSVSLSMELPPCPPPAPNQSHSSSPEAVSPADWAIVGLSVALAVAVAAAVWFAGRARRGPPTGPG